MADITELQGITKKIGFEDIYWDDGIGEPTFSCPTYTGSAITLNKVPPVFTAVVYPESYGGIGGGTTDDTAAVQAAHDALPDEGGTIIFNRKNWVFNLTITKPNVIIRGSGAQYNTWWDFASCRPYDPDLPVITVDPVTYTVDEVDYTKPNVGFGLHDILLNGGDSGKYGLHIRSAEYSMLHNFQIQNFRGYCLKLGDTDMGAAAWCMSNQYVNFTITCTHNTGAGTVTDGIVFEVGDSYITNQNFVNGIVNGPYGDNDGYCVRNGFDATWTGVYFQCDSGKGLYKDIASTNGVYNLVNCTVEGPYNSGTGEHDYSILHNTYSDSLYHVARFVNTHFLGYFEGKNALKIDLNEVNTLQYKPKFYDIVSGGTIRFTRGIDADEEAQDVLGTTKVVMWREADNILAVYAAGGTQIAADTEFPDSAAKFSSNKDGYGSHSYSVGNCAALMESYISDEDDRALVWPAARLMRSYNVYSENPPEAGFGVAIDAYMADSSKYNDSAGRMEWVWSDPTTNATTSFNRFLVKKAGEGFEVFNMTPSGSGPTESAWDGNHLVMGGFHLWFDGSNNLRAKYGAPTGATDGTIIGPYSA